MTSSPRSDVNRLHPGHLRNTSASSSSDGGCTPEDDDNSVCDLSEFVPDSVFPMGSGVGLLDNAFSTNFSEESLRDDIEKVEPMRPEQVRWFYCTKKKKKLKPMLGYDSLRLETEWRRYRSQQGLARDMHRVHIRGGMYEADVSTLRCFPIYWSTVDLRSGKAEPEGEPIIRGSWFFEFNWQPLAEELAQRVEREHVERWKGIDVREIKELMNNKVMHSVQLDGCHVDWNSVNDVLFYKDATTHRAFRNIVQRFGVSKATSGGYRLHRGYKEAAVISDNHLPVSYLVLVVHGIGSKPDKRKVVRNTAEFRSTCHRVKPKNFTERVEFIPVEWRSKVKLDGDIVETITPRKSQGVRRFLNHTAMDIMYYASPLYRHEIVSGLRNELNRIHKLFMEKNPRFDGKICLFAHSLGSVILHDILADGRPNSNTTLDEDDDFREEPYCQLNFTTETLFCVGSPMGVFLCLRGYRPPNNGIGIQDDIIPTHTCRRIFNIFHPADPVAYRLEPLILPHYTSIPPVQVKSYSVIAKTRDNRSLSPRPASPPTGPLDQEVREYTQENTIATSSDPAMIESTEDELERLPPRAQSSYFKRTSFVVAVGGAAKFSRELWSRARRPQSRHAIPKPTQKPPARLPSLTDDVCNTSSLNPLLEKDEEIDESHDLNDPHLENRIDYELPEGFTESKLGYAAFTSHTSYWNNQDLACFFMTHLYTDERYVYEF